MKEQLSASEQKSHQLNEALEHQGLEHKLEIEALKLRETEDQALDNVTLQQQLQDRDREVEKLTEIVKWQKTAIDERDEKLTETNEELERVSAELQDYVLTVRKSRRLEGTAPDLAALEKLSQEMVKPILRWRDDSGISVNSVASLDGYDRSGSDRSDDRVLQTIGEDK